MNGLVQLWQFLWGWYNLPFSISILFFLGLSALQFIGLGSDQEVDQDLDVDTDVDLDADVDLDLDADVDVDLDADVDVDLDADVDLDLDADMDVDLDTEADLDVDRDVHIAAGEGLSTWASFLSFVGIGQAPMTLVLLLLFVTFGFAGWVLNGVVVSLFNAYPGIAIAGTLPLSALSSLLLTSRLSRLLNRVAPAVSTTAMSRKQLVGLRGVVVSAQVSERFGQVRVQDRSGASLTVFARVEPEQPPIARDSEVVIVAYDEKTHTYTVILSDL